MRNSVRGIEALALVAAFQLLLARDAQAYLDPGTGSFIFQAIVAMFLGAAFTVKLWWQRAKSVLTRKTQPRVERGAESVDGEGDPS